MMQKLPWSQIGPGVGPDDYDDATPNNRFYANGAFQIDFSRVSARMFVGQGADFEGKTAGNNANLGAWVHHGDSSTSHPDGDRSQYFQTLAGFSSIWSGGIAVSGASESKYNDAFGGAFISRLIPGGVGNQAWGAYIEGVREAGTVGVGSVWGMELAVTNFAGAPAGYNFRGGTPYRQGWQGQTLGLLIQSGGGAGGALPADNPIVIGLNTSTFYRGIVIEDGAIIGVGGAKPEAMLMPVDHMLSWFTPHNPATEDPKRAFNIFSSVSSQAYAMDLVADDTGVSVRHTNGAKMANFSHVANSVNYLTLAGSVSGGAVKIQADGPDTNIDLMLEPQGSGLVRVSYAAASATTPASFSANRRLAVKDVNGNTVYLAASTTTW